MSKKSKLLLDSNEMITLQTQLACVVGDRAAIALQQIHYWCDVSQRQAKREHYQDEQWWVYNTWAEWQTLNFPFWSISTVRRIFRDLETIGAIITRAHNDQNKGFWVTVNYGALEDLAKADGRKIKVRRLAKTNTGGSVHSEQTRGVQNEQGGLSNLNSGGVQNEQPTRDTENTRERDSERVEKRDSTHVPFHHANGLGMVTKTKKDVDVSRAKQHPVWQAYVRGWDGVTPDLPASTIDITIAALDALQQGIDAGQYTLTDIEALTRKKLSEPRAQAYLLIYLKTDLPPYIKSEQARHQRDQIIQPATNMVAVEWGVNEFVRRPAVKQ